ncbi:DUF2513 domain-containing protein [Paenirhodobacter populi]|nr:DUF2513 domain-containing protein [Sinirhodobacter populi]
MKLDMGLVREILLYVEVNAKRAHSALDDIAIEGHSSEEVAYHICLMTAKGFMTATVGDDPDTDDESIVHLVFGARPDVGRPRTVGEGEGSDRFREAAQGRR